jgi:hypothetical protein
MSKYSTNTTQFKDKELLLSALKEMGFDTVEVSDTAKQLYDWHGNPTSYTDASGDKAEIIIRRQHINSASNDMGFRKTVNGTYEAIISAYDRRIGYNDSWVGKLSAAYARQGLVKKMTAMGHKYGGSIQKNGKTQLIFT